MERILCAAVWYKDLPFDRAPFKESGDVCTIPESLVYPKNVDRGVVFCGHRHPHCLYMMVCIYKLKQHEAGEEVQGFLTSENRFVDRVEAAKIAMDCGQIDRQHYGEKLLYSEDLY